MLKKLMLSLLVILSVATVQAYDFAVLGSGTTQTQGDKKSVFGTEVRFEKFVAPTLSAGVVQGLSYNASTRGSSELFVAHNMNYNLFKVKNTLFAGADGRVGYGPNAPEWTAGPLIGNRIFLKENVYILAQVNYDVGLNRSAANGLRYTIGLGVRF